MTKFPSHVYFKTGEKPAIGTEVTVSAYFSMSDREDITQTFTLMGEEPYIRKDGKKTRVHRWGSKCCTCGSEFNHVTPTNAAQFHLECLDCYKKPRQEDRPIFVLPLSENVISIINPLTLF